MSDITLRLVKGSPLTNQEVDDNFANLNTDKYQAGDSASFQDVTLDNMTGPITWNTDDGALDIPLNAQVTLQAGQEFVFYAKATEAIANGDVVMFAGAQGGHLLIAKCDMGAAGFDPSHIVGVSTQSFAINDFGYVTSKGKVRSLDTSGFTEGDILYVDPTTAGGFTATKPAPPNHIVQVAAVTRSHATQGTVLTRVSHMPDTDEVPEGSTNLYFTDARAVSAIKADGDWNASNWDTAYGWGDHSTEGYLTSFDITTQTDSKYLRSDANDTYTGLLRLGSSGSRIDGSDTFPLVQVNSSRAYFGSTSRNKSVLASSDTIHHVRAGTEYEIFTTYNFTDNSSNWDTAYNWGNHSTQGYATQTYVNNAVSNLVDSAPTTLDTLNELAAALGDDPNFATTVTNSIATKASKSGDTFTGAVNIHLTGDSLNLKSTSDATTPVGMTFTTQGTSGTQIGHIRYTHRDSLSYGGNESFTIGGTETNTVILADGRFYYKDGIYKKPASGTGAGTRKDLNWDTAYSWGNHASAGYLTSLPSHNHNDLYYTETESDARFVNVTGDTMTGTLNIVTGDGSESVINLLGSSQGTGKLYVGQSVTHGGGIEYNGDGTPASSGSGGDYVTLFRRSSGVNHWTARNFHSNNDWKFRGNLYANDTQRVFADNYHPNADKWTTARSHTVTLTGDVTGSATQSVDGTGNRTWSIATNVKEPASGNWWNAGHPIVATDGVMEIGKYIDFHNTSSATSDFTARITNNGSHLYTTGRWYVNNNQRVFADDYHPNADKWTTARTITLGGDLSGSVSLDGSANVTLSAQVTNNSHDHTRLSGFANQTEYDLIRAGNLNGLCFKARWDGSTGNRYWDMGYVDGYGTFTSGLKVYNGGALTYKGNTVFHDAYHPNADKWTTARTLSLTGDVTGSVSWDGSANASITATVANDSHTHDGRYYTESEADSRFVNVTGDTISGNLHFLQNPVGTTYGQGVSAVPTRYISQQVGDNDGWRLYGEAPASNDVKMIFEVVDDNETGDTWVFRNKRTYSPYTATEDFKITGEGHIRARGNGYVNTSQRVFADNYHPNADKWTTARSITLSGDLTGSVSLDGSSNVTLSAQVVNDSHTHDTRYVQQGGTSFSGEYAMVVRVSDRNFYSDGNIKFRGSDSRLTVDGIVNTPTYQVNGTTVISSNKNIEFVRGSSGTLASRTGFSDFIGYNPSYGSYIGGGVSNASNYIYSGGYISKNGVHTLWHSGNDGSGSGLDADSVDGRHASQFTFDNFVDDAYIDFTVNGDANTYYPVTMYGSAGFGFQRYSFSRRYNWTAPSTWNTSSHKGGLTFTIEWCSDGAWGGNNKDLRVVQFHETYSTMVGGMGLSVGGGGMRHLVVWLRGGGATYRLHAPNGKTASVDVRYSDTTASNGTVFSPRSYSSSTVISEIYTKYAVRGNSSLYDGNNKVWHAGNDGSGSGLDADLLDGQHASAFASASHSHSNYLTTTGKAADSNLLDGIDSNRFVYGSNSNKTTNGDPSTLRPSGFYDSYSGNSPTSTYYSYINMRHTNEGNGHGHQIAGSFYSNGDLYNRHYDGNGSFDGWSKIWNTSNDGSGSGLDADLLDGVQGSSFLRSDANDTASGQYNFTKVNDHAIQVGTIRGRAVGSQSGQYIHMYDRVHIGSPNGWGSNPAPSYGLSTHGGAEFCQGTGSVKVGDNIAQTHGGLQILRNGGTPTTSGYSVANGASIEIYSNNQPVLGFHNSGNSACSLYESSGDLYLTRWNGTATGSRLWHSNNDGSGSGLDADLLDGQHASAFASASHSHSYLPLSGGTVSGNLSVTGITTLGNGSGDKTKINDILELYATDSGDSHFYFGEDSSGGYGSYWNWDSSYTHTWYSRHAGTNTSLMSHDKRYTHKFRVNRGIERVGHSNGYFIGSYNSTEANSAKTNPIYTIGDNYRPTDTSFGNMYGIGYAHSNMWGGGKSSGWGLYVNEAGRVFCTISGSGMWHEDIGGVWGSSNDGSGSGLDADLLDGQHASAFASASHSHSNYMTLIRSTYSSDTLGTFILSKTDGGFSGSKPPGSHNGVSIISTQTHSGNYFTQLALDTSQNQLWIRSANNSSSYGGWTEIWASNNDGSGSGLDADLLDGVQGSSYMRTTSETNLNMNSYNITDVNSLSVQGAITAGGNITAYSDSRLKDNVETLDGSKVYKMRGVSFTKDGVLGSGVIAQELEQVAPELVTTNDDEMQTKSVAYGNVVGYLIEAIKEQQTQLNELQAQIKSLKGK